VFDSGEIKYLVLTDRAVPYLLARVRWPDVAQAISADSPDWIDDQGLFDLPYDPSAVTVSFLQAASVMAGWGRRLDADAAQGATSYIRRMPANWSQLSPSEQRTWGIGFVGRRRRHPASRVRRARPLEARVAGFSAAGRTGTRLAAPANGGGDPRAGVRAPAANGHGQLAAGVTSGLRIVVADRRGPERVRLVGRAHIRSERTTVAAGLVDLSERGVRCVLPERASLVRAGATVAGPFLLEAELSASRICLDVAGQISWHATSAAGTHFGVAFGELADEETEAVQRLLACADRRR
jgi:hypothetical protein